MATDASNIKANNYGETARPRLAVPKIVHIPKIGHCLAVRKKRLIYLARSWQNGKVPIDSSFWKSVKNRSVPAYFTHCYGN